ncbi:MAG: hypothetical protein JXL84_10115 [Deltaproteobacteria bacterium]|nr:hypothetical protein [Deltaproteobacteria bacterium]
MNFSLYELTDGILISLYRVTGFPLVDYYLGTFLLAFIAVVVGEFTISLVFKVNKAHLDRLNARVEKMSRLSEEALRRGDRESYKAINKEGNDAFGHLFFNKFGLATASLWPIFLALAWMQERFAEIGLPLPWIGWEINYVFFFLLCYIPARMLFSRLKPWLPYFRGIHETLMSYDQAGMGQKS